VASTGLAASAPGTTPTFALLENLPDAILLIDDAGAVAYANAAAEALFTRSLDQLAGASFPTLLTEPYSHEYEELLGAFARGERPEILGERREIVARRPDGAGVPIELSLSEVHIGQVRALVAMAHDISERKLAESRLRLMADQDGLTETVNRIGFERALTQHVVHAARYGNGGSIVALGIDNFRYANQSLGIEASDKLLLEVSDLIRGRLRKTDILGRVGDDVFGVLLHGADETKALELAEELLQLARQHAFVVKGEAFRITMSAGVTALGERSLTGAQLLAEAEAAMHLAKDAGRDRVHTFEPTQGGDRDERRAWSERVRQATERGLFILTSQPIVNLRTGEATQHEILLRMREDGGGLIEPASFLATAERFGLIGKIDRWVTQQSIRLIAAHNKEGRELTLEVNLSGKTMGDLRFPDEVKHELRNSGIDPASLTFEVTETAAVADIKQARAFAQALSKVGCRFALDDFGSGYASFYYLKHLPITYLKIDGEFVKELPRSPVDQQIIGALVQVCSRIGVKTIAEFVEDQQTMDILRELGVDFAQGYHLGRPAPVSELRNF
jgi:diguanylate cyclase (GGDEF)-like protein/PAS domain S-box-containing protein